MSDDALLSSKSYGYYIDPSTHDIIKCITTRQIDKIISMAHNKPFPFLSMTNLPSVIHNKPIQVTPNLSVSPVPPSSPSLTAIGSDLSINAHIQNRNDFDWILLDD